MAHETKRPFLCPNLFRPIFEFFCTGDQRTKIETERHFDRPAPPFPGKAFTVRAVAPKDQAAIDQSGQVPPQGRRRHAMRAQGELLIGREHDQSFPTQRRLRVKAQQSVQHGQRTFGNADARLGGADRAKHMPFVHGLFGRPRLCDRLACHVGKRQ